MRKSPPSFVRQILFDRNSIPNRPDWPGFSFPSLVFNPSSESPYRLYFASHSGREILVALAKTLDGPWQVQINSAISLDKVRGALGHIGSPEVYLKKNGVTQMLFHAPTRFGVQLTFLANSRDGLKFVNKFSFIRTVPFYARLFKIGKKTFVMTKGGDIFKRNIFRIWSRVNNPFINEAKKNTRHNYIGAIRHVGILTLEGRLYVFFTKIGDAPERILCTQLNLTFEGGHPKFVIGDAREVIAPTAKWEGANVKVLPSASGASKFLENALRDPFPFFEQGADRIHLFYVGGGESTLGRTVMSVSELKSIMSSQPLRRGFGRTRLVCVVGFSHAGTTLMYRMLSRSPGSGYFPFETNQFLKGVSPELANLLVDRSKYRNLPPEILIEKTPRHALWATGILDLLPGTKFIFMIRDIRDVAGSQLRRFNNWGYVKARLDASIRAFHRAKSMVDVQIVRYEDLVSNPEEVLKAVCGFTGLTYSADMINFYKSSDPWQGNHLSSISITEPSWSQQNGPRRAFQMTKPIFNAVGEGRLGLSESQLRRLATRYADFQTENNYS